MFNKKDLTVLKVVNTVTFLIMVAVNVLANLIPLNGVTTGDVSDSYPNLFSPAGITFIIWGLIYLLLAVFVLYQFGVFGMSKGAYRDDIIKDIGLYFSISSVANAVWIFAWHNCMIFLSTILILIILICMIVIASKLSGKDFSTKEKIIIKLPFSIYFGWITIATIANITTLLVSLGWNGWGIPEQIWTVIVMIVGVLIGIAVMVKNKDVLYGFAVIWGYIGILIKHLSANGFNGQYPAVIITAISSIVILALTVLFVTTANKKHPLKL